MKHPAPTHRAPALLPLTLALLSTLQGARAAEAESALDPVVVTAQRGRDTNTVVRAGRIEVEQALSLQDLFRQTPEVNISGGLSVAQKLYVRGIGERMLNVTIDGASQPESAYHHTGQVMIEPDLLKRVEIEAGTGAATAGPGALAGALRFTTKSANDLLKPDEQFGALLKQAYQSNADGSKSSGTVFGRLGSQVDFLASLTLLDTDDYVDGHGDKVQNSATEAKTGFVKLGFSPLTGHRLELAHERHEDEGLRNKRTNLLPAAFNATERQRTERESTTLNYKYLPGNDLVNLSVVTYLNDNAINLAMDAPAREKAGTRSHGLNVSNVSRLGTQKLTYGLDYRHDTGYASVPGVPLPDEQASVKGLYLQDDIAFADQWLLGLGGRYDQYDYTDMKGQDYDASGFSPSASLAFKPLSSLTLRLSHARALRGVGIVEPFLKQFQDNASHIEPEKARNTEFSVGWQEGPWQANGAVFEQRIDNYIGYDNFHENLGQVTSRGFSASAGYKGQQWSASLGVSQSKPKLNGQPLADGDSLLLGTSSGRNWVAQVDYQLPQHHLKFGWTGRLVEKLSHVPAGTDPKPGYNVHDIYTQWQPMGTDTLSLTLTIKNLFDQYYRDQSSFGYLPNWGTVASLPEAGRDVRVALAWRF